MSVGWIESRDFEVKHWGKAAQVDIFRSSNQSRQGCPEKTNFAEMRNEVTKANALKRAATEKQEELDKTLAKKESFYWEKKFVISDKILSSVNLFLFLFS